MQNTKPPIVPQKAINQIDIIMGNDKYFEKKVEKIIQECEEQIKNLEDIIIINEINKNKTQTNKKNDKSRNYISDIISNRK